MIGITAREAEGSMGAGFAPPLRSIGRGLPAAVRCRRAGRRRRLTASRAPEGAARAVGTSDELPQVWPAYRCVIDLPRQRLSARDSHAISIPFFRQRCRLLVCSRLQVSPDFPNCLQPPFERAVVPLEFYKQLWPDLLVIPGFKNVRVNQSGLRQAANILAVTPVVALDLRERQVMSFESK